MSMWTLVIALATAIIVWYLIVRQLTARPWIAAGEDDFSPDIEAFTSPAKKIALYIFLAVIGSLFALFFTAYMMRMSPHDHGGGDWHTIPKPAILWLNTLFLVSASIAMQWAKTLVNHHSGKSPLPALAVAGSFSIAFLVGQLLAWQQLHSFGDLHLSNPALGFFYLLTGVHALHIIGGLYVWGRTVIRVCLGITMPSINLSIELCTVYWHYLLLIWLVMFGLLLTT